MIKANQHRHSLLVNWLLAALSANEQDNVEAMTQYLQKASLLFTGYELPIGLTHAYLIMNNQRYQEAINVLKPLHDKHAKNKFVLKLLIELYEKTQQWDALIVLLPQASASRLFNKQEYQRLTELAYTKELLQLTSLNKIQLQQLWSKIPKDVRQQLSLVKAYVKLLIEHNDYLQAERVITRYLSKQWNDDLVLYYAQLRNIDDKKQLKRAEKWLNNQPNSAALLLMLGQLCVHQRLWGKAKQYLQQSLQLTESPQVHYELGRIYSELGEEQLAKQHFQQGLQASLLQSS